MTSPAGKQATIVQKAKRKISLPWFRQASVAAPHPALARQHTIDTPGSFQAQLLRQQPSLSQVPGTPVDSHPNTSRSHNSHLTTIDITLQIIFTLLISIFVQAGSVKFATHSNKQTFCLNIQLPVLYLLSSYQHLDQTVCIKLILVQNHLSISFLILLLLSR